MESPLPLRSLVPLVLGLLVGGLGAVLFLDSLPAPEGSAEERAQKLEVELDRAQKRLAALEAAQNADGSASRRGTGLARTIADGARGIGEDIRAGRPVNPEDIFRTTKPILRELAPIFDRLRIKQQKAVIDGICGELTRKYQLTPGQDEALKQWFAERAEEEAKRWQELLGAEGTTLEELTRASRDVRPDEGLEQFMEGVLSPEKYAAFKADRLEERVQRVENEADRKVQRLDAVVGLDEAQRNQIFAITARRSRDYDPQMVLDLPGVASEGAGDPGNGDILSVLRPDQRAAYEAERKRRYEEASKAAAEIGMTVPPTWELMDDEF